MMASLTGLKWYLIVVLIGISLMASNAEHPFMCLWALCMSVLLGEMSGLLHLLANLHWIVYLPVLSQMNSLCVLEIKPFSDVSLANMFSHVVGALFILVMFSLAI